MKRKRIEVGRDGATGSVKNSVCVRVKKKKKRGRKKERIINSVTPECRIIRII